MNLKNNPRIKIKNLNATKKGAYKNKKYKKNNTSYIYNPLNLRIKTLKMLNNRKNKKSYLTNKHDTLTFIKQIYPNNKCKSLHDNSCVLFKNNQYDKNITLLMNEPILTNKNKNINVAMVYELPIRKRYYLYKFPLNSSVYKKKQGKYILRKGAASFLNNACEIYLPKLYLNNKQEMINDNTIVMSYLIIAHKKSYSGGKDIPLLKNVQSGGSNTEPCDTDKAKKEIEKYTSWMKNHPVYYTQEFLKELRDLVDIDKQISDSIKQIIESKTKDDITSKYINNKNIQNDDMPTEDSWIDLFFKNKRVACLLKSKYYIAYPKKKDDLLFLIKYCQKKIEELIKSLKNKIDSIKDIKFDKQHYIPSTDGLLTFLNAGNISQTITSESDKFNELIKKLIKNLQQIKSNTNFKLPPFMYGRRNNKQNEGQKDTSTDITVNAIEVPENREKTKLWLSGFLRRTDIKLEPEESEKISQEPISDKSDCGLTENAFKILLPPLPTIKEIDTKLGNRFKSSSIQKEFANALEILNSNDPNDKKNKFNIFLATKINSYNPPIENTSQSTTSISPESNTNSRGNESSTDSSSTGLFTTAYNLNHLASDSKSNSTDETNEPGRTVAESALNFANFVSNIGVGGGDTDHPLYENETKRENKEKYEVHDKYHIDYKIGNNPTYTTSLDVSEEDLDLSNYNIAENEGETTFFNFCKNAKFGKPTHDGKCIIHNDQQTHKRGSFNNGWVKYKNCSICLERCEMMTTDINKKIFNIEKKLKEVKLVQEKVITDFKLINSDRKRLKKIYNDKKFDKNGYCVIHPRELICNEVKKGYLYSSCKTEVQTCNECNKIYVTYLMEYINLFKTQKDLQSIIEQMKKFLVKLNNCKSEMSSLTYKERAKNIIKGKQSQESIQADADAGRMTLDAWINLTPSQQKERLINARKADFVGMNVDDYDKLDDNDRNKLIEEATRARDAGIPIEEFRKAGTDEEKELLLQKGKKALEVGVDFNTFNSASPEEQENMIKMAKEAREVGVDLNTFNNASQEERENMIEKNKQLSDTPGVGFYNGMEDEMILFRTRVSSKLLREILNNSNLTGISTDGWFQNIIEEPSFNKHEETKNNNKENKKQDKPSDDINEIQSENQDGSDSVSESDSVNVVSDTKVKPPHVLPDNNIEAIQTHEEPNAEVNVKKPNHGIEPPYGTNPPNILSNTNESNCTDEENMECNKLNDVIETTLQDLIANNQ